MSYNKNASQIMAIRRKLTIIKDHGLFYPRASLECPSSNPPSVFLSFAGHHSFPFALNLTRFSHVDVDLT